MLEKKAIIELFSVDFSCQLHNGSSSVSTVFIFCIGSLETKACCVSHCSTMSIYPTIKMSHYHGAIVSLEIMLTFWLHYTKNLSSMPAVVCDNKAI